MCARGPNRYEYMPEDFHSSSEEAVSPDLLPPATQTTKSAEHDAAIKESLCREEK